MINVKKKGGAFVLLLLLVGVSACKESEESLTYIETLKKRTVEQLVFVEGGTFMMGDVGYVDEDGIQQYFTGDEDTRPVHQVALTSYSIQAYEVTLGDFDFYTQLLGNDLVGETFLENEDRKPQYAAKMMTWDQSRAYCQWLGEQIGYSMDLPTEAQWEYAARNRGEAVAYATDNGKKEVNKNLGHTDKQHYLWRADPVGSWPATPLGLYDMTGNVSEWTADYYRGYRKDPKVDPRNDVLDTMKSQERVVRGVGWNPLYRRAITDPANTGAGVGMRCVVNHPKPIKSVQ